MGPGKLSLVLNAPATLCLTLILAYPIFYAGFLSFHQVSVRQLRRGEYPFIGLENFTRLLNDDLFWLSLSHTFVFVAVSVALEVIIALAIALVINERSVWISRVTRFLILLPWAVPPVVNGLLWSFIFNAQYGYLNRVLWNLGLIDDYVNWLGDSTLALTAVIVAYVWRTTPFNILLYHAALQGIPQHLYEAAEVDGRLGLAPVLARDPPAPSSDHHRHPRAPDHVRVHGVRRDPRDHPGRPRNDTWMAAWYTYKISFQPPFNIGVGAASAYVLALIIGVIAIVYVRFVYRRVEY